MSGVQSQAPPGPVSLEIFGVEEVEDAPLELPLHATITVLPPTPAQSLPPMPFLDELFPHCCVCPIHGCSQQLRSVCRTGTVSVMPFAALGCSAAGTPKYWLSVCIQCTYTHMQTHCLLL